MAIAVSAIVSPKSVGVSANRMPLPNAPMFGIVEGGAGPWDVLWSNGTMVDSIAGTALDEITDADTAILNGFVGRRVKRNVPTGQNNWGLGVCVAAYKRTGVNTLLLQLESGAYVEASAGDCVAVN